MGQRPDPNPPQTLNEARRRLYRIATRIDRRLEVTQAPEWREWLEDLRDFLRWGGPR